MPTTLTPNEQIVIDYLKMVEQRTSAEELNTFYHEDVQQIEYPNAIVKNTAIRSLQDLKDASERGKKILIKEVYEVQHIYSSDDNVILEAIWKGTLSIPLGNIPAGGEMTAYFAQFFQFKDGKIYRQRNYDCFEPFN
ncbi:nuclear transport factor 2 family protein [Cytophaga aurantiaca]|uniref:nuclear transport factor 2 family protein n=1 Tax=Cytophaga aurantiaca TaxID=29530 RepID=UPI00035D19F4|nr:nuclear transport factor 2 family protein [Cytophaga aurantiaca]